MKLEQIVTLTFLGFSISVCASNAQQTNRSVASSLQESIATQANNGLCKAVIDHNTQRLQELLSKGANPNISCKWTTDIQSTQLNAYQNEYSLFGLAMGFTQSKEITDLLIRHGVNPEFECYHKGKKSNFKCALSAFNPTELKAIEAFEQAGVDIFAESQLLDSKNPIQYVLDSHGDNLSKDQLTFIKKLTTYGFAQSGIYSVGSQGPFAYSVLEKVVLSNNFSLDEKTMTIQQWNTKEDSLFQINSDVFNTLIRNGNITYSLFISELVKIGYKIPKSAANTFLQLSLSFVNSPGGAGRINFDRSDANSFIDRVVFYHKHGAEINNTSLVNFIQNICPLVKENLSYDIFKAISLEGQLAQNDSEVKKLYRTTKNEGGYSGPCGQSK